MSKFLSMFMTVAVLCSGSFFSCKAALFDMPVVPISGAPQADDTSRSAADCPAEVTATHGGSKAITVSWTRSPGAVRYYIYSAESPFSGSFEKCAEVAAKVLSYTDANLPEGATRYYRVTAAGNNGTESGMSKIAEGTTLATPLITSIEPAAGAEDSAMTVQWWMSNCTDDTYRQSVTYTITCKLPGASSPLAAVEVSGTDPLQVTLSGLSANTQYVYSVTATVSVGGATPASVSSGEITEETARRTIPDAPTDINATQGTATDKIDVTWKLPPFVDTAAGSGTYERHPLYFKIYRAAGDGEYTELVSYFGSVAEFAENSDRKICFADQLSGQTPADDTEISETYTSYIPGLTVCWTDTTAVRGMVYKYKVVSYVDDCKREISSGRSQAEVSGWLLPKPSFGVSALKYTESEDGTFYASAALTFTFTLEERDVAYTYVLNEHIECLNDGIMSGKYTSDQDNRISFKSQAALNSHCKTIPLPEERGRYSYTVAIQAPDGSVLDTVNGGAPRYVTEELTPLVVENMRVADGYADKMIISWTMFDGVTYKLEKSDDVLAEEWETIDISSVVYDESDPDVSFVYPVEPGAALYFRITPSVENDGTPADGQESTSGLCLALGVPEPRVIGRGHTDITLEWAPVQKADTYFVSYRYKDQAVMSRAAALAKFPEKVEVPAENIGVDTVTCTLPDIAGSGYADLAGLPLEVTVTAKNTASESTTAKEVSATVIGPAGVYAAASKGTDEKGVILTWQKDPDAAGYLIVRRVLNDVLCTAGTTPAYSLPFTYYVPADGSGVTAAAGAMSAEKDIAGTVDAFVAIKTGEGGVRCHSPTVLPPTGPALKSGLRHTAQYRTVLRGVLTAPIS